MSSSLPETNPSTDGVTPESRQVRTLPQLMQTIERRRRAPVLSLGDALRLLGLMDEKTLQELIAEDPTLLRSRSVELVHRLLLTEEDWHRALARVAGLVEIDVLGFELDSHALDILPLRIAHAHGVVPLGMANEQFFVASWAPTSDELYHQLCSLTGHSVGLVWASRKAIERRLEALDHNQHGGHGLQVLPALDLELSGSGKLSPVTTASRAAPVSLDELVVQAMVEVGNAADAEQLASASDSAGMVRLVNQVISDAQLTHASDIHIETNAGDARTAIRFRRDGDMEHHLWVPAKLRGPLVSRIKIMAKLDIAERRRPQDGKIDFSEFGGKALELRVAVMPTHDGLEDVVLRLLESAKPLPLSKLGLQSRDQDLISGFSQRTFGLVLAAGPTGSGKTTTLHSMLAEVNTAERKIWTAEDPIEITQPGLRQVQVNPKIGLTFASAMRGFLRADPDIIMIGEVRDAETARIAIEASLTGHLVLSTLHTNNACESVVRLLDLGMDAMNFADSLLGIVAQRLVRALCTRCASDQPMDEMAWESLLEEYMEGSAMSREQAQTRLLEAAGASGYGHLRTRHAVGCEHCSGKGYKGRMGIYEILQNSRAIKSLIQSRARPSELFDTAVAEGMRSLRHDALEKVVQGHIDLKQARSAYR